MRFLMVTLFLLTGPELSCGLSPAAATEPLRLRVISYNIHHGEGVDRRLDLPRIANVLKAERPDLVALQEVDQRVGRSGNVDQPQELARLTGLQAAFGSNIALQGGHYGNAVLSRFPIVKHWNRLLPNVAAGEQRGLLGCELELPDGAGRLLFCSTHFDHRRDPAERVQSAEQLPKLLQDWRDPILLAGDLNDVVGSQTLQIMKRDWLPTNTEPLPTIPVDQPKQQIDFILVRPQERWRVVETRVLDESIASDHRAILSVVELLRQ